MLVYGNGDAVIIQSVGRSNRFWDRVLAHRHNGLREGEQRAAGASMRIYDRKYWTADTYVIAIWLMDVTPIGRPPALQGWHCTPLSRA